MGHLYLFICNVYIHIFLIVCKEMNFVCMGISMYLKVDESLMWISMHFSGCFKIR